MVLRIIDTKSANKILTKKLKNIGKSKEFLI